MKIKIWFWILCTVIPGLLSAQNVLSGTVVDRENLPLAGATVSVAGSYDYTISDSLGHFAVALNQSLPVQLSVHLLGFEPQALTINSSSHVQVQLLVDNELFEVVVTARRRSETAQDVPIPITVLGGKLIQESGAFNVNRMKELVPSVQLYSSNPRNTGLSIRGLGTTFGLTNDGIDPGVGFYVDGVYYVRTAATTLDFIDVEQIEVLRGPQGTLFGKNTVAGALNITTRKPDFKSGGDFEMSFGDYGFIQAKGSLTGPLGKKLAARLSFSGTQRDGLLTHAVTQKKINDLNNLGLRGQLLFVPNDKTELRFIADVSRQRPDGYAQVFAGVAPTLRAEYRQFENIISDLEYNLPARNPFDRIIDHDTPWRSGQDFGGISLNADFKLGPGTLTSTSSWRYWNWDPSNDRDFTGLPVLTLSQAPSKHNQWSQEVRYAGTVSEKLSGVIGVFLFGQDLRTNPYHTEESGAAQWRFSQNSASELWKTPGLFEGYGIRTTSQLNTISGAIFSQVDIELFKGLHLLPGLRFNYDKKEVDFNRQTYGGLVTEDPALIALKNVVYTNQAFEANIDDTNLSGQLTLSYKTSDHFNAFATYSTGFKPVGLNLGGLPSANGAPLIELAVVKPEHISHTEIGIKTKPNDASTLNLTVYNSDINNFQAQVQTADLSVNRGYLANAEKVRVRGIELDGNSKWSEHFTIYGAVAYTEGKYVRFTNAPPPLEETGGPTFKDISGGDLPGISRWAGTLGAEISSDGRLFKKKGAFFLVFDSYARSTFSSNPSPSRYLVVDGYVLVNARIGFRAKEGISLYAWSRNLFDQDYFEQILPGAGNAGHYAGVLGDPRTVGLTVKVELK